MICEGGDDDAEEEVKGFRIWKSVTVSWSTTDLNEMSLHSNSRSKIRLGVKLTIHCGVCVKKMAAQWILCRLEGVMQATWRNHTSEDVDSCTLIIIITIHIGFLPAKMMFHDVQFEIPHTK